MLHFFKHSLEPFAKSCQNVNLSSSRSIGRPNFAHVQA